MTRVRECHDDLFEQALSRRVVAAFADVCAALGAHYPAALYARALATELGARGLRVERDVRAEVRYGDVVIGSVIADLVVESTIVVQVCARPTSEHTPLGDPPPVEGWLRALGLDTGLLLQAAPRPTWRTVRAPLAMPPPGAGARATAERTSCVSSPG